MKGVYRNKASRKMIEIHCRAGDWKSRGTEKQLVATDLSDRSMVLIPESEFNKNDWERVA